MTLNPAKDHTCVLAYDWGEGSGNIVYDLSLHANYGTIYGAMRTRGILRYAVSCDGIDDKITVLNSKSLNITNEVSVIMWIKPLAEQRAWLTWKGGYWGPWLLDFRGDLPPQNNRYLIYFTVGESSTVKDSVSEYAIELDDWQMIGGIAKANNYIKLIYNGNIITEKETTVGIASTTQNLILSYWYYFSGLIGSVRIYNRALSEKEIRERYYYGKKVFAQPDMYYHRRVSPILSMPATELARVVA